MKTMNEFNLAIADDHILLRDALARLINTFDGFLVKASAANGKELIELIKQHSEIDIVLLDLNMPEIDGYEAAKWIARNRPDIKIIVLTMFDNNIALIRLLHAGVYAVLKKDIHPDELRIALSTVAAGTFYSNSHSVLKLLTLFRKHDNEKPDIEKLLLTDTEIEFLKLVCQEMTYKEIAKAMYLTTKKIDYYRDTLFIKLDVKSRIGLVIFAIKNGVVNF